MRALKLEAVIGIPNSCNVGTAEETGREMNEAIAEGDRDSLGIGEAVRHVLARRKTRSTKRVAAPQTSRRARSSVAGRRAARAEQDPPNL